MFVLELSTTGTACSALFGLEPLKGEKADGKLA